jgi:Cys-tRNA(Pro)/Cys-tRNA(Cys) deacylase
MDHSPAGSPAAADLPVTRLLTARGIAFTAHRHGRIRTVDDIHARTGFSLPHSVKTLAFTAGGHILLAAVPGPARIRYGRLAAAVRVRRGDLAPADEAVLRGLGMEPGGVTPLCPDPAVTVVFDQAVPLLGRVFCGSGRADHTLQLSASDLVRFPAHAVVAAIASEE